jgi:hypothetical protein
MIRAFAVAMLGWAFVVGAAVAAEDQTRFTEVVSIPEVTITGRVIEANSLQAITAWTCEQDGQASGVVSTDGTLEDNWPVCLDWTTWENGYYE